MSGYLARNPLMTDEPQFGPPPVVAGRPVLPNALATPAGDWRDTIAPQPTQADAADATAKAYTEWLARDRAEQVRLGHVDPATGALTPEGWRAQAQTVAGGFGPADIGAMGIGAIKTYHGTPHLFEPTPKNPLGEFRLDKIGTGEGSQVFGQGMYVAEREGVAQKGYRDPLSGGIDYGGQNFHTVAQTSGVPHAADVAADTSMLMGEGHTAAAALQRQADISRAAAEKWRLASQDVLLTKKDPSWRDLADPGPLSADYLRQAEAHDATANWIEGLDPTKLKQNKGHMYEVNLNAEPHEFLHWDKPLSEQSPQVQERLGRVGLAPGGVKERAEYLASLPNDELRAAATRALDSPHDPYGDAWMPTWDTLQKGAPNIDHNAIWDIRVARNSPEGWGYRREGTTGEELYRSLGDPVAAAEALRQAGIPGVRYLDAGSRNAGGWHITPADQTTSGKWMVKSSDYNSKGLHFDTEAEAQAALQQKIGAQTHNYAVWSPEIMEIVRRYGIAGLIGGGAAATTAGGNQGQNQ